MDATLPVSARPSLRARGGPQYDFIAFPGPCTTRLLRPQPTHALRDQLTGTALVSKVGNRASSIHEYQGLILAQGRRCFLQRYAIQCFAGGRMQKTTSATILTVTSPQKGSLGSHQQPAAADLSTPPSP